jgi:hypothetical protein
MREQPVISQGRGWYRREFNWLLRHCQLIVACSSARRAVTYKLMLDAAITGFSNRAAAFAASRRTSIGNGELEIAVLRRFPPMQFDEKSVQKLSGLAIIKVCALHMPDQNRLRIALYPCVRT